MSLNGGREREQSGGQCGTPRGHYGMKQESGAEKGMREL